MAEPKGIVMPNDRARLEIRIEAEMDRMSLHLAEYLAARREGLDQVIREEVAKIDLEAQIKRSIAEQVRSFAFANIDQAVKRAFLDKWGSLQEDIYNRVKAELETHDFSKPKGDG